MLKKALNWKSEQVVNIYDELPLWSAKAGMLLLDNIPMQPNQTVVDLGYGTGFPLIELAQRFGEESKIIGIDIWKAATNRAIQKVELLELSNVEIHQSSASEVLITNESVDLVCSNLGINNFENKSTVLHKVHAMLKQEAHFCLTTNDSRTFIELHNLFRIALTKLELNTLVLEERINSREEVQELVKVIIDFEFELVDEISDVTLMRFSSPEAIFNHSIIRIAFLESWQELVSETLWPTFVKSVSKSISEVIQKDGFFSLSVPVTYLNFKKV